MPYEFKGAAELKWAIAIAVLTTASQLLVDVDKVTDWKAWTTVTVASLARAAIAGALIGIAKIKGGDGNAPNA